MKIDGSRFYRKSVEKEIPFDDLIHEEDCKVVLFTNQPAKDPAGEWRTGRGYNFLAVPLRGGKVPRQGDIWECRFVKRAFTPFIIFVQPLRLIGNIYDPSCCPDEEPRPAAQRGAG